MKKKIKKILLIRTSPVGAAFKKPSPPCVIAPLGILYIASFLRRGIGKKMEIIVESLSTAVKTNEEIFSFIDNIQPDVVGISSSMVEENEAVAVADACKNLYKRPFIVVGGPYPTSCPERALIKTGADLAILNEGEISFANLIQALLEGGDVLKVPGAVKLDKIGNVVRGAPYSFIANLDNLPNPAWDMIPVDIYSRFFNFNDLPILKKLYVPIITSRGCPYRCSFCHNIFGKRFRARSPENVLEEIELLYNKFGVSEFHIVDDIFNANSERMERICRLIIRRGLKIALAFPNGVRGDTLSEYQLKLLKKAGCYSITFALESASPRIQKMMGKKMNLKKLDNAIKIATNLGIITSCFLMFGYPGETREEMEETIRWVRDSTIDFPRYSIAAPFPGTVMAEHARRYNVDAENMDVQRASYDRINQGIANIPPDEFQALITSGIKEIMNEPRRAERLKAIWSRWGTEAKCYFGFPPGSYQ